MAARGACEAVGRTGTQPVSGWALLRARLGDREGSTQMLSKLCELDPADRLGGQALLRVLARQEG